MEKVVLDISMSLDGFIAGLHDSQIIRCPGHYVEWNMRAWFMPLKKFTAY